MSGFICPVCGKELVSEGKDLFCENSHHFDVARSGYVNLLLSQQARSRQHGDNKLMVRSRRDFLDKGYYSSLLDRLCGIVREYAADGCTILDAGCGECWYTANVYKDLVSNGIAPRMLAVDISKDAVAYGAKRCRGKIELAVASVFRLPVREASCDMLLSLFAPFCGEEFLRVLKSGGTVVRVFPLERHLWSLKKAVYDAPYENEAECRVPDGFELLRKEEVKGVIRLSCNEDIVHVFTMTPYYYNTSARDLEKLRGLSELDTETEFGILVYRKKP